MTQTDASGNEIEDIRHDLAVKWAELNNFKVSDDVVVVRGLILFFC